MADFEDATSPTWQNVVEGQQNLDGRRAGTIRYVQPGTGKIYALGPEQATLFVRPRGWHLWEQHVLVDGQPVSAALFDFGLFFFHNAERRSGEARARTSTSRSSRATSRRASGTTSSATLRTG